MKKIQKVAYLVLTLFLLTFSSAISAQTPTASPGCQQWIGHVGGGLVGSGIPSGIANIPVYISAEDYNAGENLHFTWGVTEANTLLVASTLVNDSVANPANTQNTYTITIPADGNHTFNFDINFNHASGYFYNYSLTCTLATNHDSAQNQTNPPLCQFDDGRINNNDCDSPIVIYQTENEIDIYAIHPLTSEGTLILRLPFDSITTNTEVILLAETTHPDTNASIQLWQLSTDEIQLQSILADDKPYIIVWSLDASTYKRIETYR